MNISISADSAHGHELVDDLVSGVMASVHDDMRGKPASMVLEILTETLARRLPGITFDEEPCGSPPHASPSGCRPPEHERPRRSAR